jgi:hypothetical protein
MDYTNLLFDESPLVVSPQLAVVLGLNEAIIIQQLHYWLQKAPKVRDDRAWVYNSIKDWREQFPFFSTNTIRRTLDKLTADSIVIKGDFNKVSFDKTSWWSIDYESLNAITRNHKSMCPKWANGYAQNGQTDVPKMGKPIPETNTETNTENIKKEKGSKNINGLIENFTETKNLIEALQGFVKMRSAIKKPMTDRAFEMLLRKLDKLAKTDDAKITLLDQSIFNGWQDIYPPKEQTTRQGIDYQAERAKWKN